MSFLLLFLKSHFTLQKPDHLVLVNDYVLSNQFFVVQCHQCRHFSTFWSTSDVRARSEKIPFSTYYKTLYFDVKFFSNYFYSTNWVSGKPLVEAAPHLFLSWVGEFMISTFEFFHHWLSLQLVVQNLLLPQFHLSMSVDIPHSNCAHEFVVES